jgi:hypothetical protein
MCNEHAISPATLDALGARFPSDPSPLLARSRYRGAAPAPAQSPFAHGHFVIVVGL